MPARIVVNQAGHHESQVLGCLSGEELTAWVAGELGASDRDRVVRHVADCTACRQAASALAQLEPTTAGATTATALDPLAARSTIGRFEVERVLGRGGMGVVVAARDPMLGRDVAIKVLPASVEPDQIEALEARLVREARVLASLRDPNLVAVYEAGRDGDRVFLVMELVVGKSLRLWLETQRPDWREALRVCLAAARGVVALHAAGFVHRDLKPDNVVVADDGRVVVVDLGLARRTGPAEATDGLTRAGAIVGTPRYMAPEQLVGDPVDARADQWAFAAMTLEAVRVHGADAAPARVRSALRRAMDPDPSARFPTMSALRSELGRAANGGRRLGWIAAGVAAAITVVGVAWVAKDSSVDEPVSPTGVTTTEVPPAKAIALHVSKIQQFIGAGDGKACLVELAALERLELSADQRKTLGQMHAQCLMLDEQCEAGKRVARAYWQTFNFNSQQLERAIDVDVMIHCRGGTRNDRDRLVRAIYMLGDAVYKHTVAECHVAYADARQLVATVASRDNFDFLHGAAVRFQHAAGCFARAGDCALAWTVAKELDASSRRDSSDRTKRETFAGSAHPTLCIDQDQGKLGDAELVWRALKELELIEQVGTRPASYCETRIDLAAAALRRLGNADPQLGSARGKLKVFGARCRDITSKPAR